MKTLKRIFNARGNRHYGIFALLAAWGDPAEEPSGSEAAGTDAGEAAAGSENTGRRRRSKSAFPGGPWMKG